jgi:hypothetical protein
VDEFKDDISSGTRGFRPTVEAYVKEATLDNAIKAVKKASWKDIESEFAFNRTEARRELWERLEKVSFVISGSGVVVVGIACAFVAYVFQFLR